MSLKSFRSRVNTVVRRSSMAFSVPRPSTPRSDSDAGSIKQSQSDESSVTAVDTAPLTLSPPTTGPFGQSPSPIAESPAREAAAIAAEAAVSSPLAQVVTDSPAAENADLPTEAASGPPDINEIPPTPHTVIPEPVLDQQQAEAPIPSAAQTTEVGGDGVEAGVTTISTPNVDAHQKLSAKPSNASLVGSSEVWGGKINEERGQQGAKSGDATFAWGMPTPEVDAFGDLAPAATEGVSTIKMPQAGDPTYEGDPMAPISMPLPPIHDIVPAKSLRAPSRYSAGNGSIRGQIEHDTDESRPLLSRPGTPQTSYLRPTPSASLLANPSVSSVSTSYLQSLGWLEYVLPDSTVYYIHPTMQVTTDIDLRNGQRLQAVSAYFEGDEWGMAGKGVGRGCEMWLRDVAKTRLEFHPIKMWVDHGRRQVSLDPPSGGDGRTPSDDKLDMEYRYWSFMEAHPAHTTLPTSARTEAMDALTWSYTDRLLPSHRPVPPPFSQEECHELMTLLRSFGEGSFDTSLQSVVQTRIVSRILLRVAHWRQLYFRPDKPLPIDASKKTRRSGRQVPFRRAMVDFLISFLCLGIPFIFMERSHTHRVDEESGLRRGGPTQMLVIGACSSLVAAVVLSASVTFISLPGLDSISRVAGLVAILCSTGSMASSVLALFRYKMDLERELSAVGGEGLMNLSRRSISMSLPLVFLAYAIGAFITAVVLYSFRGSSISNGNTVSRQFEEYTRWAVVGTLGGLGGMLIVSTLLVRR